MYTRAQAVEFWYQYDQRFLFARPAEVIQAMSIAYPNGEIDALVDLVRDTPPTNLANAITARTPGIRTLARLQLELMDKYFPDPDDLQRAFEDFGQGVLIDSPDRRPPTQLIHMMNGTPDTWVGYHRWHAFNRCASVTSPTSAEAERWDQIDRLVALAWAIQSEANPRVDDATNPGLGELRLNVLRAGWLNVDIGALRLAYLNYTGHFGMDDFQGSVRAPEVSSLMYQRVTELLAHATGSGRPMHSGKGRFWLLPEQEFLVLNIYGEKLIATPGPNRGSRSALIMVLKGELANFPQMPLNRPPMAAADIAFIERWIDQLEIINQQEADTAAVRRVRTLN